MTRHDAYFSALKYHFGYLITQLGFEPRHAYSSAKQEAAYYAFNLRQTIEAGGFVKTI